MNPLIQLKNWFVKQLNEDQTGLKLFLLFMIIAGIIGIGYHIAPVGTPSVFKFVLIITMAAATVAGGISANQSPKLMISATALIIFTLLNLWSFLQLENDWIILAAATFILGELIFFLLDSEKPEPEYNIYAFTLWRKLISFVTAAIAIVQGLGLYANMSRVWDFLGLNKQVVVHAAKVSVETIVTVAILIIVAAVWVWLNSQKYEWLKRRGKK